MDVWFLSFGLLESGLQRGVSDRPEVVGAVLRSTARGSAGDLSHVARVLSTSTGEGAEEPAAEPVPVAQEPEGETVRFRRPRIQKPKDDAGAE